MKKIRKIMLLILSTLLLSSCSARDAIPWGGSPNGSGAGYRQVSSEEAARMMQMKIKYTILDVRRPDEFAEGHIPGAINIPNETIGDGEIPELPNKNELIFVYCRSGRRSKEAAEKLVALGYTDLVEFGGILDWKGEIVK